MLLESNWRRYSVELGAKSYDAVILAALPGASGVPLEKAKKVLLDHRKALDAIADKLIEVETMEQEEFEEIVALEKGAYE